MKALVYEAPETLGFRDMPDPVAASGEELIRVDAVGICGSDMHAYLGHDNRRPAPLILGHEAAGVIVGGARDGERVTVNPLVTCETCRACKEGRENLCASRQIISMPPREGAFAQYVAMPPRNLVTVPGHIPFKHAALAEPLAVSWHALRLGIAALFDKEDARCLVLGGGAIGVGAALAAKAMGLSNVKIAEPNSDRRRFLSDDCALAAVEHAEGTYEVVVDAVGLSATRATASALAAPGGVIVHIGLAEDTGGLDIRRMTLQEITFIGTYTYTAQDFRDTAQAIFDGTLGDLGWIDTRPLSDGATAFRQLRTGQIPHPKIVLEPWS